MITPNKPTGETMEEGSDLPPAKTAAEELCVPVAALAVDGTEPAAGDETEVPARIKITRVDGGKAYFELAAVNGEAVTHDEKAEPAEDDMMKLAAQADEEMG